MPRSNIKYILLSAIISIARRLHFGTFRKYQLDDYIMSFTIVSIDDLFHIPKRLTIGTDSLYSCDCGCHPDLEAWLELFSAPSRKHNHWRGRTKWCYLGQQDVISCWGIAYSHFVAAESMPTSHVSQVHVRLAGCNSHNLLIDAAWDFGSRRPSSLLLSTVFWLSWLSRSFYFRLGVALSIW